MAHLADLEEAKMFLCQMHCEKQLKDVLTDLRGLVRLSDAPAEIKERLMQGIEHLGHHIDKETRLMLNEQLDRAN